MVVTLSLNKTLLIITIIICIILLYVSFVFNSCLLSNISRTLKNTQIFAVPENNQNESPTIGVPVIEKQHLKKISSIVRMIPLTKINNTNASLKKRFLRQQGLRPFKKLPNFLIIGVKKCGTRALLEFIRLHPDCRAAGTEIHFFDRHYQKGLKWYRQKMPVTLEAQVTIEKTPSYFVNKDVPGRVRKMNPKTKLLVVVRDPVTRCISDFAQAASKKKDMKKFEDLAFVNGSTVVDFKWGPVKIGVYAKHLENWLKFFPLKSFLFISGERLIAFPSQEMSIVQDFLNIKRIVTDKHFYFNSTKGFPCLLKSEGRSSPHCLGKTKGRSHPHIAPEKLENLRSFYRPFNEKFYQLTGINFGWP